VRPILIGASRRDDGRLALVYSVRPGRRITIIGADEALTEELAEEIASRVIPLIDKGTTERTPA
jgi:hypothetical protein